MNITDSGTPTKGHVFVVGYEGWGTPYPTTLDRMEPVDSSVHWIGKP